MFGCKGCDGGAKGWLGYRGGEAYIHGTDSKWWKGTTAQS